MKKSVKEVLMDYRECTLKIIDILEKGTLDSLHSLVEARQQIVDNILAMECTPEEVRLTYEQLELRQLQVKVTMLMKQKMSDTKQKLLKLSVSRAASNTYYKNVRSNAYMFSFKR